jgi:signal transduction histidine kinase
MPMKRTNIFARVRHFATLYLASGEEQRRSATVIYVIVILLAASSLLIAACIVRQYYHALYSILAADAFLLIGLALVRRGHIALVAQLLPITLIIAATYAAFHGQGIHDISLLVFPMAVALGGLIQKKHSALLLAGAGTLCYWLIYFAEVNGLIANAQPFSEVTSWDDTLIMALLLWTTATFIYFATSSLTHSLGSIRMNEQALQTANKELEQYAAILEKRTQHLLTGARVARAATSILDPGELSQQAVDMVCERFALYYVSLFLVDKTGKWAVLAAGTGEAGQQMLKSGHRLRIGNTSMIGWCIANRKARIALDVGKEAVRFNNPLLPRTRSELALPLISRGEVIGALGIQSDQEAAFSEEDVVSFQAMSDQLANAIRNAQLYDQLQRELKVRKRAEREIRKLNQELEKRVTERTAELQSANERLTTLSRLKDEFLANVSHELRTPITSIMLYHTMIEKKPAQASTYISSLKRETQRLAHLIEELLYLSRLEQGRVNFNPEKIDLNQVLREYVADRAPLAKQRRLNLMLDTKTPLPAVQADEQMIGQVVSILLTNALNYTPAQGQVTVRTQADERQGQKWAGFVVQDTGLGLTAEDQKRVFERFFRGKAGRESAAPGTGLGLSIAREIVEKHRGRIEVHSEGPGKGATFTVWLPTAG